MAPSGLASIMIDESGLNRGLITDSARILLGEGGSGSQIHAFVRNICFFAGTLTNAELESLFKLGVKHTMDLPNEYIPSEIGDTIKTNDFYVGLLGAFNVSSINILNCAMKYNGRSIISVD